MSESGIHEKADVERVLAAGVSAFLNDSNDRSANAKLSKLTKILAIIFVVITLLVYILQ